MINKLPHWVLVDKFPAFNDLESLTAIEQTARIYGKINELIDNYNKFIDEINKAIEEYEIDKYKEVEVFISRISILTNNYINTVDMKIAHQDRQIAEVYDKFSNDVINNLKLLIAELKNNGVLDTVIYEALENIDGKIDTLLTDYETFKDRMITMYNQNVENLKAEYDESVENIELEYKSNASELANDYADIKNALTNDYADTKNALTNDYADTKEQLNTDYTHQSQELEQDYNTTKTNLENDYAETKANIEKKISGVVELNNNMGKTLWYSNGTPIPRGDVTSQIGYLDIPNVNDYTLVQVAVSGGGTVLCNVMWGSDEYDTYTIIGAGTGSLSSYEQIQAVHIYLELSKTNNKVIFNYSKIFKYTAHGTPDFSSSEDGVIYGIWGVI